MASFGSLTWYNLSPSLVNHFKLDLRLCLRLYAFLGGRSLALEDGSWDFGFLEGRLMTSTVTYIKSKHRFIRSLMDLVFWEKSRNHS